MAQGFSCDSSWACLKTVAATAKHPVMAPAGVAQMVVSATLDVHPPTASERVSYMYAAPGSGIKVIVLGTRGTFFKKATLTKAYSVERITIRHRLGEQWITTTTPQTVILWWQADGWTWRISGEGPDSAAVLARQAESLRAVQG
jgi:hypothetical protein